MTVVGVAGLASYPAELKAILVWVALFKSVEALSDIFHGELQHRAHMEWICLSLVVRGLLTLAVLALAVSWTHRLEPACLGIAVTWLLVLLAVDVPCVARLSLLPRHEKNAPASGGRQPPDASLYQGANAPRSPTVGMNVRAGITNRGLTWGRRWQRAVTLYWDAQSLKRLLGLACPLGLVAMLLSLNVCIPRYFLASYWGERTRRLLGVGLCCAGEHALGGGPRGVRKWTPGILLYRPGQCGMDVYVAQAAWTQSVLRRRRPRRRLGRRAGSSDLFLRAGICPAPRYLLLAHARGRGRQSLFHPQLGCGGCPLHNDPVTASSPNPVDYSSGVLSLNSAVRLDGAAFSVGITNGCQVVGNLLILRHAARSLRTV